MDQTVNFGFDFPECSRPLVADASDIIQLKELADDVDLVVQGMYDAASQAIVHPDCCRMQSTSVAVASTVQNVVLSYDLFNFDNTPGQAMTDTANGVMLIQEDGLYLLGHYAFYTGTVIGPVPSAFSARFIVNGVAASNWTTRSGTAALTTGYATAGDTVLRLNEGDTVTTEVFRANLVSGNWNTEGRLFGYQLLAV